MAVSITLNVPDQPAQGGLEFLPLGGDGKTAPLGCYLLDAQIDGDASAGNAGININLDPRYTNLVAFINFQADSTTAGPEFILQLRQTGTGSTVTGPRIVGTAPQVALSGIASFLWYPPPIYYPGAGFISLTCLNVDATETYSINAEIYCFDIDVRKLAPLYLLQLNVPGVSAPAAI